MDLFSLVDTRIDETVYRYRVNYGIYIGVLKMKMCFLTLLTSVEEEA